MPPHINTDRQQEARVKLGADVNPQIADRGPDRIVWRDNALIWNRSVPPAAQRQGQSDKEEEAEIADVLSVAINQPHRKGHSGAIYEARRAGSAFTRLSEALGRFCASPHAPTGLPLGDHCWQAGQRYAEIVREYKTACGFDIHGWAPSDRGFSSLTQEQIEARKELAIQRKAEADQILRSIKLRLPAVLERLCYDQLEPFACDSGIIIGGLVALALEFGMLKQKFGAEG
jgi:hypothetical protein